MNGTVAENVSILAFRYALENEQRIRKMLLKAARGDKTLAEDMFSDVALERLPRLFELYDYARPIENYMLNNIRWYAFKYVNARCRKGQPIEKELQYVDKSEYVDVLEKLSELDRYLIEANVLWEMPFTEMAQDLRWPVAKVSRAVKAAKEKVRLLYEDNADWLFVKKVVAILVS